MDRKKFTQPDRDVKSLLLDQIKVIFTQQVLSKGRELYNRNAVLSVHQNGDDRYESMVIGGRIYVTELVIFWSSRTVLGLCSCSYDGNCKHAAALAYSLIFDKQPTNKQPVQDDTLAELKVKFGIGQVNQFREIPLLPSLSLSETIDHLSTNDHYAPINKYDLFLTSDKTLLVEAYSVSWQGSGTGAPKHSITVKIEDRKIFVKCNVCTLTAAHLCSHQQIALKYEVAQTVIRDLLDDKIDYQYILNEAEQRLGLGRETLSKHFRIKIDKNAVNLVALTDDIILDQKLIPRLDKYLNTATQTQDDITDFLLNLEKNEDMANAFAWTGRNSFFLIEGKLAKNEKTLATGITEVSTAFYEDATGQELVRTIFKAFKSQKISIVHAELKSKLEDLPSFIHYFTYFQPGKYEKLKKKDLIPITFSPTPAQFKTTIIDDAEFKKLEFSWNLDGRQVEIDAIDHTNGFLLVSNKSGFLVDKLESLEFLSAIGNKKSLRVPVKSQKLLKALLEKAAQAGVIESDAAKVHKLSDGVKQIHLREIGNFLVLEPSILYPDYRFPLYGQSYVMEPQKQRKIECETELIIQFKEEIKSMHPQWNRDYVPQGFLYLPIKELKDGLWFLQFVDNAAKFNIEIFSQKVLGHLKINFNRPVIKTKVTSGIDWFEAQVNISFGDQMVPQKDWIDFLKSNQKYIALRDGSMGMLPDEWLKKLRKLVSVSEASKDGFQISKLRFNVIDELFGEIDDGKLQKEIRERKEAFSQFDQNKTYKLPANLNASLRPYQVLGYQWLRFLDDFNFGGCLADDMGLGKTVQMIAFLLDQKNRKKGTSLIVIPKSLLFNWCAEIERFGKKLNFLVHHGANRDPQLENWKKFDLVLSTYDTIARDAVNLKNIAFNYIILDESQAIKNPTSNRYRALRLLNSRNKLAMTGTPIENNTFDLYAQFSFLNPGLLGSVAHFKDHFSTPIDSLGDEAAASTLRSMVHPFLLRRTKEQVAKDLPEKTETILYCEMEEEQRKLYETLRNQIKKEVNQSMDKEGMGKAKFKILEGLLRLRQMCNAPELVDDKLPPKKKQSIKVDILMEQIREEIGNHKALIFSQFVSMLSIIRRALDAENIKYAYLDGSTRDRKNSVDDFLEDDDCNLFLISMKAGNTGLNLVKADYVYIVDPWWNPAVEAQAIDRTHRIGQTKNIFAYKLICKDSIEEKILQLQQKKKKLASDLIQTDDTIFKSLRKEELLALFE